MAARKQGRFDWFDLMTPDVEAAKAFYTAVTGWKTTKWQEANYEMWTVGDKAIGGMMALPAEETKRGTPPHWMAHIETENVDATVKKAQELGGQVLRPGTDIPTVGRFAILRDPQGALFAVFQPLEPMEDAPRKPGYFTWFELNTTDYQGAWKFYSELFGWKHTRSMDMGPEMGAYWMFGPDSENTFGGMSNVATQMKVPPHWLYYVTVENLDAALTRVKQLGGQVLNGPMDVPGGDRIAQCMDPQGGMFALHMRTQA